MTVIAGILGSLGSYVFLTSAELGSYLAWFIGLGILAFSSFLLTLFWALRAYGLSAYQMLVISSLGWMLSVMLFMVEFVLSRDVCWALLIVMPIVAAAVLAWSQRTMRTVTIPDTDVVRRQNNGRFIGQTPVGHTARPLVRQHLATLAGISICSFSVGLAWTNIHDFAGRAPWIIAAFISAVFLVVFGRALVGRKTFRLTLNIVLLVTVVGLIAVTLLPAFSLASISIIFCGSYVLRSVCFSLIGGVPASPTDAVESHSSLYPLVLALGFYGVHVIFQALGSFIGFLFSTPSLEHTVAVITLLLFFCSMLANNLEFFPGIRERLRADAVEERNFSAIEESCRRLAVLHRLTEREREVLLLLAKGYTTSYIAEKRVVSINTVKTQARSVYRKTGVHDKQGLLNIVYREMGETENPRESEALTPLDVWEHY
jgi:DNA-binding CsgD family transcriptional regulator